MDPLEELKICIVNQYCNTPLLDKIESPYDLPEDPKDWVDFDMKLNLIYSKNFLKNGKN